MSRRSLGIALGIAIVATGALVAVALVSRKDSAPAPVATPALSLDGIAQAGRSLGAPGAKVKLVEFTDPQCPACRYYALNVSPAVLRNYVRTGKVRSEYRAYPFIGEDSVRGARFLLAASFQNRLWQLQDALYRAQGAENSGWLTNALVRQIAGGIRGLDVARLFRDAESARVASMLDSDQRRAGAAGVNGTPSLFLQIGSSTPYALASSVSLDAVSLQQALDDALRG